MTTTPTPVDDAKMLRIVAKNHDRSEHFRQKLFSLADRLTSGPTLREAWMDGYRVGFGSGKHGVIFEDATYDRMFAAFLEQKHDDRGGRGAAMTTIPTTPTPADDAWTLRQIADGYYGHNPTQDLRAIADRLTSGPTLREAFDAGGRLCFPADSMLLESWMDSVFSAFLASHQQPPAKQPLPDPKDARITELEADVATGTKDAVWLAKKNESLEAELSRLKKERDDWELQADEYLLRVAELEKEIATFKAKG